MYNVSGRCNCNCTFAKNQRAYVSSVFCIQKTQHNIIYTFLGSFRAKQTYSPFGKKPAGSSSSSMPYGGGLAGAVAAAPATPAAAAPVAAAAPAVAGLNYGGLPVAPATKGKSYSPFGKKPSAGGSLGAKSYR